MGNCCMRVGGECIYKGSLFLSLIDIGNSVMWHYAVTIHGQLQIRKFGIAVALTQKLSSTQLFLIHKVVI
jgi:hypothetical protein